MNFDILYYVGGIIPSKSCLASLGFVVVVQINKKEKYVKFRNAFGPKCGENGYGRVALETSVYPSFFKEEKIEAYGTLSTAFQFYID